MRHGTGLVCPAYDRIVCVGACTLCHARCVGTRLAGGMSGKQVFPGYYFAVVSLESVGIRIEKGASGATLRWALLRSRMVVPWL